MQAMAIIVGTLAVVITLLHRRVQIGNALFAGTLLIWILTLSPITTLMQAAINTAKNPSTWDILIAMYCVMCLEFQLRTSGLLDGLMSTARGFFNNDRIVLMFMPAFLGFLPSIGGALFSAPMVASASKKYDMSPENKSTINYWFRHIWEWSNPIMPSLLLASQITQIPLAILIKNLLIFSPLAVALGWLFCLHGKKTSIDIDPTSTELCDEECNDKSMRAILLCGGPILLNISLVVLLHFAASVSMGLVVLLMVLILRYKWAQFREMIIHGFDTRLLWAIFGALLFQQILSETGVIRDVVVYLHEAGIPIVLTAAVLSLVGGLLTGTATGFVAIAFPIICAMAPGNVTVIVFAFIVGCAGQMLSPIHMCFLLTVEYFKANYTQAIKPVLLMEIIMVVAAYFVFIF